MPDVIMLLLAVQAALTPATATFHSRADAAATSTLILVPRGLATRDLQLRLARHSYHSLIVEDVNGRIVTAPLIGATNSPSAGQIPGNFTRQAAGPLPSS
jgi:hypothetical protein